MPYHRKNHALIRGVEFICSRMQSGEYSGGSRLPPAQAIAEQAQIAVSTVWKALRDLEEKGALRKISRRFYEVVESPGASITRPPSPIPSAQGARNAWQRTQQALRSDILNGVFPRDAGFPQLKELQNRYDVSYATMKKALTALVEEGFLQTGKRGYRIPQLAVPKSLSKIVVLGTGTSEGMLDMGPHETSLLGILEPLCNRMGIILEIIVIYQEKESFRFVYMGTTQQARLVPQDTVLGYIYLLQTDHSLYLEILHQLAAAQKPVAILDEVGKFTYPQFVHKSRFFKLFTVTITPAHSYRVGKYLLGLGHRRIAYLSLTAASLWVQLRLQGLQQAFADAGFDQAVTIHVYPPLRQPDYFLADELLQTFKKKKSALTSEQTRELEPMMWQIESQIMLSTRARLTFRPVLEEILYNKEISALVCGSDSLGIFVMDFIAAQHRELPHFKSVISFDDTFQAMQRRLTSYNFNIQGLAHIMLNFLVRPLSFTPPGKNPMIAVAGNVVVRGSCAAAQSNRDSQES